MHKFKLDISDKTRFRLTIVVVIVSVIALVGITMRAISAYHLRRDTNKAAVTTVNTTKAEHAPAVELIVLPGNVQAWHEATIFARTNGYVKDWKTDIGAHVKAGDLLAVIETPELDAQLRQAEADLRTAEANNHLAQTTAIRWRALLKTESVSKQETDEKNADALAKAALVSAALANRDHLKNLVSFNNILAPFDGTITSRTTDIGSLISSGSTTQRPLFHIVQADPIRIYVRVPQNYSARITPDMTVELVLEEHPGKIFPAKLLETAKAIDPSTRTLLVEFTASNKSDELLTGGYAQVRLKFPAPDNLIRLPVNTLIFRAAGLQIATLDDKSNVVLKSVSISRDFGEQVEINSGVKPGENVVINPPDSLVAGQHVNVEAAPADGTDGKDGKDGNDSKNGKDDKDGKDSK